MLEIRFYFAGRVGVAVGTKWLIHERQFRDRQGRRALAYLACCRDRPVPRSELARIIWPDEAPPAWESALSALISRLRRLLEHADLKRFGVALSSGFGQDQLHTPAETWVDLEAAAAAIDEAEGALRAGDPLRAFGFAGVTYAIAPRPFLSGDDGAWVESQRRTLDRQFLRALECLAKIWLATGEPILAIECATRALAIDPFRETSHQLLMTAHAATGNRGEAIRSYHRLRDLLVEELGVDPTRETEALYLELLRGGDVHRTRDR
jgi:DNA-binding SARP family transcriptional activator